MAHTPSFMQGTTPALTIRIDPADFSVADATAIEIYVLCGHCYRTYTLGDLILDTEENTITKQFTAEETAKFIPGATVTIQGRFWFSGGIVGIEKIRFPASDMIGVGADG